MRDTEIAVPDIAGWRREHLPRIPRDPRFEVAPDRICNVLSPNKVKHDLIIKMPLYARYGVAFCGLLIHSRGRLRLTLYRTGVGS